MRNRSDERRRGHHANAGHLLQPGGDMVLPRDAGQCVVDVGHAGLEITDLANQRQPKRPEARGEGAGGIVEQPHHARDSPVRGAGHGER